MNVEQIITDAVTQRAREHARERRKTVVWSIALVGAVMAFSGVMSSCSSDAEAQPDYPAKSFVVGWVGNYTRLFKIKFEGHEYIGMIREQSGSFGAPPVHSESCPCKVKAVH